MHHLHKKVHFVNAAIVLAICIVIILLLRISITGFIVRGDLTLPFIDPLGSGLFGNNRRDTYDLLVNAFYENNNVTKIQDGKLIVPWYSTSIGCAESDLRQGDSCNVNVSFSEYCMVSDEFSQLGVLLSMGTNQARMNEFYNTLGAIKSTRGTLPAWKVYVNAVNNTIEPCLEGINGNCDTASDASARTIISLLTASTNPDFADAEQKQAYHDLGIQMAQDFVAYEIENTCRPSNYGQDICYWLASGSNAKDGGPGSVNFAYTGYFADAIIAMLQTCTLTGDLEYCAIASNLTLNYLQASNYNSSFSVPPGRAFRWGNLSGTPVSICSDHCDPVQWDSQDAPRAFGMCEARYYSTLINYTLPSTLDSYCDSWSAAYVQDPTQLIMQYNPDGSAASGPEQGYFAQGLQTLFQIGTYDSTRTKDSLDSALSHFTQETHTWDGAACFGVYHGAFSIRALGDSIGKNIDSFPLMDYPSNETDNGGNDNGDSNNGGGNTGDSGGSSGGGGGGGGGGSSTGDVIEECTSYWECAWTECTDGMQQATSCIDTNQCAKRTSNPVQTRECAVTEEKTTTPSSQLTGEAIKSVEKISLERSTLVILLFFLVAIVVAAFFYRHHLKDKLSELDNNGV